MKLVRKILILFVLTAVQQAALAQVTNDNLINYYAEIYALEWNVNNDSDEEEPTWRWFWRTSSSYSGLSCLESNYQSGFWCYNADSWLREYPKKKISSDNTSTNVASTTKIYTSMRAHENDGAHDCYWDLDLFNEDNNVHCRWDDLTIKGGNPCSFRTIEYDAFNDWSKGAYRIAWRYSKGDTRSDPLTFGSIGNGQTRTHFNSNRARPDGSNTNSGYTRSAYNTSPDVTYSFSISKPSVVTISTDYGSTNFNTYLRLLNNSNGLIAADDNSGSGTKSRIVRTLCPGTYKVFVEGASTDVGEFTLGVNVVHSNTVVAGSYVGPGNLCVGADIPRINSTDAGSVGCGSISYQWIQYDYTTDMWGAIPGATGASYDPPGQRGTESWLSYYRDTKDQYGNTKSNGIIHIGKVNPSLTAGSYIFTGSDNIPG
ncbi:MAG: hypothetical protein AB8G22_17850, partial [Saprospiraceae bacterium]